MLMVERHSFYTGENKKIRYSEYWPSKQHEDRNICGCTREVSKRPNGNPDQITQDVTIYGDGWDFKLFTPWLTFRKEKQQDPHAYFIFWKKDKSLKVEVVEPYTMADFDNKVFIGDMFLGNEINIGDFFNGHSPSKIVNLSEINPNDLWTHCCSGEEAYSIINNCPDEIDLWRDVIEKGYLLRKSVGPYLNEHNLSVENIYYLVEQQQFSKLAEEIKTKLEPYSTLKAIKQTEFFRMYKIVKAKSRALQTMRAALT